MSRLRILFLAANPDNTVRLRIDAEARSIREKLRASGAGERIEIETRWAVRPDDLIQELNEYQPHVVHFSGHGSRKQGLAFHDDRDGTVYISGPALSRLFRTLKDQIRLVVLNACYSSEQADGILDSIDLVVAVKSTISDAAANEFAASFYRAVAFGRSLQNAFDQGLTAMAVNGLEEEEIPEIRARDGVAPAEVYLSPRTGTDGGRSAASLDDWVGRAIVGLGIATALYALSLRVAGFTAPKPASWLIAASFLAWMLGAWRWLRRTRPRLSGRTAAGSGSAEKSRWPGLPALAWLASTLLFLVAVLGAFPGLALGPIQRERWRIDIPNLTIEPLGTETGAVLAELPLQLRQKFSALYPQVEIIDSAGTGLSGERQACLEADYRLSIVPQGDFGLIKAEISGRGLRRKAIDEDLRIDSLEVVRRLSEELLGEMTADGLELSETAKKQFDNFPTRRPEAWDLNKEAVLAILRSAATEEGAGEPAGLGDPAQHHLEIARQKLDRALALDPSFAAAVANRAWLDELAGNSAAALEGYQSALSLSPYFAPFSYQLGRFRLYGGRGLEKGSLNLALRNLENATRFDETYWQAFNELGNALLRANQADAARRALEEAEKWVPPEKSWVVRTNLARAQLQLGRLDEARRKLEAARRVVDAVPLHRAEVDYYLALTHRRGGDLPLACESLASALRSDPAEALPLPEEELMALEGLKKDCRTS